MRLRMLHGWGIQIKLIKFPSGIGFDCSGSRRTTSGYLGISLFLHTDTELLFVEGMLLRLWTAEAGNVLRRLPVIAGCSQVRTAYSE